MSLDTGCAVTYGAVERRRRPRNPHVTWHRRRGEDGFYLPPPVIEGGEVVETTAGRLRYVIDEVAPLQRTPLRLQQVEAVAYLRGESAVGARLRLRLFDTPGQPLPATGLILASNLYDAEATLLLQEVVFPARFPLPPLLDGRVLVEVLDMELAAAHAGAHLGTALLQALLAAVAAQMPTLVLALRPNPLQYQPPPQGNLLPGPERRLYHRDVERAQRRLMRHFMAALGAFPSRKGGDVLIAPLGHGTPRRERGGWQLDT